MMRNDELSNPESCINRAKPNEMVFVLLGRDPAAPVAIRAWCAERIRVGKNVATDKQILDAMNAAYYMETHNPGGGLRYIGGTKS